MNELGVNDASPGALGRGDASPSSRVSENGDVSEADSELMELEMNIAKIDESVRAFVESRGRGRGYVSLLESRGRSRRGPRGPRKAAELTGDVKYRLGEASRAFIDERYDEALDLLFDVIRINAETHQAWTMLASVFREFGDVDRALNAMVYSCHLRPREVDGWIHCAEFALESTGESRPNNLTTASLCYAAAIRIDQKNTKARLGKAAVNHEQGHISLAIAEYKVLLGAKPFDIETVRSLSEVCLDSVDIDTAAAAARDAYIRYINHFRSQYETAPAEFGWTDVKIYVELCSCVDQNRLAVFELKALSRWILGRRKESFWDACEDDDREWDVSDDRRKKTPEFVAGLYPTQKYGPGLPPDLRAILTACRLRLGHIVEAKRHISILEDSPSNTLSLAQNQPEQVEELADQLLETGEVVTALKYYNLVRQVTPSARVLLQSGRCYLAQGNQPAAEELFLAAIEADEDNIDARVELAGIYEAASEEEEAFILVNEALNLQERQDHVAQRIRRPREGYIQRSTRCRPRRLVNEETRREEENAREELLGRKYQFALAVRDRLKQGDKEAIETWMMSAKELIDDFKSFKLFYSWEKYLRHLGYSAHGDKRDASGQSTTLSVMAQRLSQNLVPKELHLNQTLSVTTGDSHRGIPLTQWLDLFLDYALNLAHMNRSAEAYEICECARDAIVFSKSTEAQFLIHVAWGACAVVNEDEETCVAVARFFMRDDHYAPDSYRLFSTLCRVCQSPVSWYSSGPAQKFILRQIKSMDSRLAEDLATNGSPRGNGALEGGNKKLPVSLLMLYGHILFTSTSYVYALSMLLPKITSYLRGAVALTWIFIDYFLRAMALDHGNPMISLSIGLAYLHHALKRQSENRQYLLSQSFSFLFNYHDARLQSPHLAERQEAHYNIARSYQLVGLHHLAIPYYLAASHESTKSDPDQGVDFEGVRRESLYNLRTCYLAKMNNASVKRLLDDMVI